MMSTYLTMSSGIHLSEFMSGTIPFIAPECVEQKKSYLASPKRDTFSFAMTLYELLFPRIKYPWAIEYSTLQHSAILESVCKGVRPCLPEIEPQPDESNQEIVTFLMSLMKASWLQQPQDRPSFHTIVEEISVFQSRKSAESKSSDDLSFDPPKLSIDGEKEINQTYDDISCNLSDGDWEWDTIDSLCSTQGANPTMPVILGV